MLSRNEERVLKAFREYLITPGEMLCFYGPDLEKHTPSLRSLSEKKFLVKERFKGGYSLTKAGFKAMKAAAKAAK